MNLFDELKRRNVFRVAAAYAVVGWLIIQVIDTISPRLGLPEWVPTFIIVLVLIGFPIAFLLAWAFEMTPEGVKKTGEVDESESITATTGQKLNYTIAGALVLALGVIAYQNIGGDPPATVVEEVVPAPQNASIAVLPFADLSPDGSQEYFGDGIAEELLNALVKLPGLKVTGRTSSFQFKGQNPDLRSIGEQLNVTTILEGSVRTSGTRVRITAQLINAADGFHLWSESYDREMTDIFAVQDEISQAIVAALRVELTGEASELVTAGTTNIQAYDFYLRARSEFAKRNADGILAATAALEEAVRLDPNYADAWGMLSLVYGFHKTARFDARIEGTLDETAAKMRRAAETAIAINPNNTRALVASARQNIHDWKWEAAGRDFNRALALSPNDAEVNNFFGDYLRNTMDHERQVALKKRVTELDPLFATGWFDLGWAYIGAGRYEEALTATARGHAINPRSGANFRNTTLALYLQGRYTEARQLLEQLERRPGLLFLTLMDIRLTIAEGNLTEANRLIDAWAADPVGKQAVYQQFGELLYNAGRFEEAYVWLDQAYMENPIEFNGAHPGELGDPRIPFKDPAIAEIYERPGLKELMDIRRRNLGLDTR